MGVLTLKPKTLLEENLKCLYFTWDPRDKDWPSIVPLQRPFALSPEMFSGFLKNRKLLHVNIWVPKGRIFSIFWGWCILTVASSWIFLTMSYSGVPAGDVTPFYSLPAHFEETEILTAVQMPHSHTGKNPFRSQSTWYIQTTACLLAKHEVPSQGTPAANRTDASPHRAVTQESVYRSANVLICFRLETLICAFYTDKQFSHPKQGNKTVELWFSDLCPFSWKELLWPNWNK